jgi:type II secretory pathway pseudopilin PulG
VKTNSRGRRNGEAGFSIVEVMFATGVLVVGLVGAASAVTSLANLRRTYTETQAAITAARAQIEEIREMPFNEILPTYQNGVGFTVDADADGISDLKEPTTLSTSTSTSNYTGPLTVGGNPVLGRVDAEVVTDVPPAAVGKLIRCIVRVRWNGVSGTREIRLVTMVSDGGN